MSEHKANPGEDHDLIVLRRSDLFKLLGEFALPPWLDGSGSNVDCAPIAEAIIARVEQLEW